MANDLDNFDKLIHDVYEGHELPYDHAQWENIKKELDTASPALSTYFAAMTTGLIATGLVFMSMLFFLSNGHVSKEVLLRENSIAASPTKGGAAPEEANPYQNLDSALHIASSNRTSASTTLESSPEEAPKVASVRVLTPTGKADASTQEVAVQKAVEALDDKKTSLRKGCTGLVINFRASEEYGDDAKYLWNFGDGYFSNEANPSHTFNKEGIFDVSLSVTSPSTGQIRSNVVQAMIEVVEAPEAQIAMDITSMNELTLKNASQHAEETSWVVNGESQGVHESIALSAADNTRFEVLVSAANENGCTDSLSRVYTIKSADDRYPTAWDSASMSPFAPGEIAEGQVQSLKIFHAKTGELLSYSQKSGTWNGTTTSGAEVNKGTYVWVLVAERKDELTITRGTVAVR